MPQMKAHRKEMIGTKLHQVAIQNMNITKCCSVQVTQVRRQATIIQETKQKSSHNDVKEQLQY